MNRRWSVSQLRYFEMCISDARVPDELFRTKKNGGGGNGKKAGGINERRGGHDKRRVDARIDPASHLVAPRTDTRAKFGRPASSARSVSLLRYALSVTSFRRNAIFARAISPSYRIDSLIFCFSSAGDAGGIVWTLRKISPSIAEVFANYAADGDNQVGALICRGINFARKLPTRPPPTLHHHGVYARASAE